MGEPLDDAELARRWAVTLGAGVDPATVDPAVTQRPPEGTVGGLPTVAPVVAAAGTLSGDGTLGGSPASVGQSSALGQAGGYELIGELGRGGMGVVYRARQRSLAREIALKFIRPEHDAAGMRERFVAEALVNGLLDHPNIVPVHELGANERGEAFLVMKLVGGRAWKDLLHPRTEEQRAAAAGWDLDRHLSVLQGVGNAVAFAHSRGILHRDLKPENVMVGEFGEVLVMDWGIAVDIREHPEGEQRTQHKSTVTAPAGTPSYMAPELAEGRGRDFGPWTDVYLLGAILHELLTGGPPHRGPTLMAVLLAASRSVPATYGPTVPAGLAAVAVKAMAREPAARYATVAEFQAAIAQFLKHRESETIAGAAQARLAAAGAVGVAAGEDATARSRRYAGFAEALAGFNQALVLWDGNATARAGAEAARLAYAGAALAGGDLGLAEAQLDGAQGEPVDALRQRIVAARTAATAAAYAAKRNRRLLVGSTALIVLGLATGVAVVSAERAATAAQRDKALAAEQVAQQEKAVAQDERSKAEAARGEAERERATAQARLAQIFRQRAADDRTGMAALWEVEWLRAAAGRPEVELLARRRLAERFAGLPRPQRLLRLPGVLEGNAFPQQLLSDDGRVALLSTSLRGGSRIALRAWDLDRGVPLAAARETGNNPVMPDLLALSRDGRTLLHEVADGTFELAPAAGDGPWQRKPRAEILPQVYLQVGDGGPWLFNEALPQRVPLPGVTASIADVAPDRAQLLLRGGQGTELRSATTGAVVASLPPSELSAWAGDRLLLIGRDARAVVVERASGAVIASGAGVVLDESTRGCWLTGEGPAGQVVAVQRMVDTHPAPPAGLVTVWRLDAGTGDGLATALVTDLPLGEDGCDVQVRGDRLRVVRQPVVNQGQNFYAACEVVVQDWTLPPPPPPATPLLPGATLAAVSADGAILVVVANGQVHRLRAADRSALGPPVRLNAMPAIVAVSPDGARYALVDGEHATIQRSADGTTLDTITLAKLPPADGAMFSADGRRLVVAGDGWLRWSEPDAHRGGGEDGRQPRPFSGDWLGGDHRLLRPWLDGAAAETVIQLPDDHSFVVADTTRDGATVLARCSHDDRDYARLFDARSGAPLSPEIDPHGELLAAALSPDGATVALLVPGRVRLFHRATGEPASPPLAVDAEKGEGVDFSADGRLLIARAFGIEYLWDVATHQQILATRVPRYSRWLLADGTRVLADGTQRPLPLATEDPDLLAAWAALYTGQRIDSSGVAVPMLPQDFADAWKLYDHERARTGAAP